MTATLIAITLAFPVLAAERRGSVAFHYGPALSAEQLEFLGRFDVLVTHDPLPAAQVATLHKAGTRLVLYEWSVAFYRTLVKPGSWHASLLGDREALLNVRPLRGGAGAADADAFYYDPASPAHEVGRVRALAKKLKKIGYDGVFFDTTTVQSVHPQALEEFERRHPGVAYDAAFACFLQALRRELKDGLIVTNQGFRAAEHYLPYADYEITESLITHPVGGRFVLRPDDEIAMLMRELIGPVKEKYPSVPFVHLNYGTEVRKVLAIARQFGDDAFVAAEDVTATLLDAAYFDDADAIP